MGLSRRQREALIEQAVKDKYVDAIVDQTIRQFGVPSRLRGDLISAGNEALVKAANTFDPDRGTPFKFWAQIRIRGACKDEMRKMMGARSTGEKDEHGETIYRDTAPRTVSSEAIPGLNPIDPKTPISDFIQKAQDDQTLQVFWAAMARVSKEDREVVFKHYVLERSIDELKGEFHLSYAGMRWRIQAAMGRVRDQMWEIEKIIPGESVTPKLPPGGSLKHARSQTHRSSPGITGVPQQKNRGDH